MKRFSLVFSILASSLLIAPTNAITYSNQVGTNSGGVNITNMSIDNVTNEDATITYSISSSTTYFDIDYRLIKDNNQNGVYDNPDENITIDQDQNDTGWNDFSANDAQEFTNYSFQLSTLGYTLQQNTQYIFQFKINDVINPDDTLVFKTTSTDQPSISNVELDSTSTSNTAVVNYTYTSNNVNSNDLHDVEYRVIYGDTKQELIEWTNTPQNETTDGEYTLTIPIQQDRNYQVEFRINSSNDFDSTLRFIIPNQADDTVTYMYATNIYYDQATVFVNTGVNGESIEYSLGESATDSGYVDNITYTNLTTNSKEDEVLSHTFTSLNVNYYYRVSFRQTGEGQLNEDIIYFETQKSLSTIENTEVVDASTSTVTISLDYTSNTNDDILYYSVNDEEWKQYPTSLVNGTNTITLTNTQYNFNSREDFKIEFKTDNYVDQNDTIYFKTNYESASMSKLIVDEESVDHNSARIYYTMDGNSSTNPTITYSYDNGETIYTVEEEDYGFDENANPDYTNWFYIHNMESDELNEVSIYVDGVKQEFTDSSTGTKMTIEIQTLPAPVSFTWLWITLGVVGGLLVVAISIFIYYRYNKIKKDKIEKPWKYV